MPLYKICIDNVICITLYLPVDKESLIEDTVIKTYLELYLRYLNESKSYKKIQVVKKRMLELIKRKQLRNSKK